MTISKLCPCGSKYSYQICCGRYHKGKINAPTAEALMRSRYSAYVLHNYQYVFRTWDKNTRPPLKILAEDTSQRFTHLKIISTKKGNIDDDFGTVEFKADYNIKDENSLDQKNETYTHHENSYFEKKDNQWKYVNEFNKIKNAKE